MVWTVHFGTLRPIKKSWFDYIRKDTISRATDLFLAHTVAL